MPTALPAVVVAGCVLLALVPPNVRQARLPDRLTLGGAAATLAVLVASAVLADDPSPLLGGLLGAAALSGSLLVVFVVDPAGVGPGVVKAVLPVGLALGALGLRPWAAGLVAMPLFTVLSAVPALLRGAGRHHRVLVWPGLLGGYAAGCTVALV